MSWLGKLIYFKKIFFAAVLVLAPIQFLNATPMAPVMLCDGQACPSEGYDLSSYNIPFSYSWPTPPNITDAVTVTPNTLAANNVPGRRLTLAPGNYGDVRPSTDQEWILQDGAQIDAFIYGGAQRIRVSGATPRAGRIGNLEGGAAARDVLFDGIYQSSGSWTDRGEWSNGLGGRRIAIINSSLNTHSYNLYAATGTIDGITDIIIAGNLIRSDNNIAVPSPTDGQHTMRLMSLNTFIIVGNYIEKVDQGQVLRIHTNDPSGTGVSPDAYDGYIADNVFVTSREGNSFMAVQFAPASNAYTPGLIRDLVFENNRVYATLGASVMAIQNENPVLNITIRGNDGFGGGGWPSTSQYPSFTVSGNSANPYTTPPSSVSVLGF